MIIHDVEQGTPEWHALRAGIPTASAYSKLVTSQGLDSNQLEAYAIHLAAEKFAGKVVDGFGGNAATRRGHEMEPLARAEYQMLNGVLVEEVGFITDSLMRFGCSPDGLVGKDGGIEIKCKTDAHHYNALSYYHQNGSILPEHIAQVQGCMMVTKRKWWDLMFWHPDMPSLTVRQYPDQLFHKQLKKQIAVLEGKRAIALEFLKSHNPNLIVH